MGLLCLAGAIRRSLRRPNAIFDLALFRFQSFRVGALLTVGILLIQAGCRRCCLPCFNWDLAWTPSNPG